MLKMIAGMLFFSLLFALFMSPTSVVHAADPQPLQDFCVADLSSPNHVNGFACLNPSQVTADHFFLSGLDVPGKVRNAYGSTVNLVTATEVPGLNTLGISMIRSDYPVGSLILPHYHPRASEILTVIQGTLEVGFVTSNPENKFFSKVLEKGDVFVFPVGLVHYESNVGGEPAVAISGLSTQNLGFSIVADATFGSKPPIPNEILAKAFSIDDQLAHNIQVNISTTNQ